MLRSSLNNIRSIQTIEKLHLLLLDYLPLKSLDPTLLQYNNSLVIKTYPSACLHLFKTTSLHFDHRKKMSELR
jgi:hypothetical protein